MKNGDREKMIKVIASDLDGTLVPKGTQSIDTRIYEMIRELKKKGILFVSASGRQLNSQRLLFAPVAEEISYIAENGAICVHKGECIHTTCLEEKCVHQIFRALEELPTCKVQVSCPDSCYILPGDQQYYHHVSHVLHYRTKVVDDFYHLSEPVIKVAALDQENFEESLRILQNQQFPDMTVQPVGNNWIDFIPTYSNKGTALLALLKHLGVDPADCVAFGDYQNDIQMLQIAGRSYAMADGSAGAKEAADYLTDDVVETISSLI